MFLSRLLLDPRNRMVHRDLGNCHELHRTVLSAFPDADVPGNTGARAYFKVLYRLDASPRYHTIVLLVQSGQEPDWGNLPEDYVLPSNGKINPVVKDISPVLDSIKTGMKLRFRLKANPTKKIKDERGKSKRVALFKKEDRMEWFARKATNHGFHVDMVKMVEDTPPVPDMISEPAGTATGWKKRGKSNTHKLTFSGVVFNGYLRVTDKEKFVDAMVNGIGSAKGYGYGLLSIAPPKHA